MGTFLVGFSGGGGFLKVNTVKTIRNVFTCFVYVLRMWLDSGGALKQVQIFIMAEGVKIESFFFLPLSGRRSSLVQTFLSILCTPRLCLFSHPHIQRVMTQEFSLP